MVVGLKFPKDQDALVKTLRSIVSAGEPARNREKVRWTLVKLYLQGVRNFTAMDWNTGSVSVEYPGGTLRDQDFRFDKIVTIYETQMGRLLQADFSPVVARRSQGLDDLRKASIAQVVLDHALSKEDAALLKLSIIPPFLRGGHVGIGAFNNEGTPRIETIPGWELGPIPANPVSSDALEGIYRIRWVTYSWLLDNKIIKRDDQETRDLLNLRQAPIGLNSPNDMGFMGPFDTDVTGKSTGVSARGTRSEQKKTNESQGTAEWTTFLEVWTRDRNDYLQEYIPMAGNKVLTDLYRSVALLRQPMPIQIARYIDTGGFYGRGMLEQFIPLNNEVEFMLQQLFRNVESFDIYGFLCVSTGMGLTLETIQEARTGDKVLVYSPDPMQPTGKPFNLPPSNSNKLPIAVVQMAIALMDSQSSGQSDLFSGDAPGRVDNAKALSFLFETANIPLTAPMESISIALSRSYRALLYLIKQDWGDEQNIPMSLNDDILVGVKYDSISGQLTLDSEAIPHPDDVLITVSSKMPKSLSQRKAELAEHLSAAVITPREYRIMSRVEGLDLPVGNEHEWQSWRKAKMENVLLFGDGKSPGEISPSDRDYHEVHLEVLSAFMVRPEYPLASEDVQNEFAKHHKFHQEGLQNYPEAIPYPDQEAELVDAGPPPA